MYKREQRYFELKKARKLEKLEVERLELEKLEVERLELEKLESSKSLKNMKL